MSFFKFIYSFVLCLPKKKLPHNYLVSANKYEIQNTYSYKIKYQI